MVRPTRLRRPSLRFSEDDYIVETRSRKPRNKIEEINSDNKGTSNKVRNVASKSRSVKGNLFAAKKTVVTQMSRSPVLRDRTNLPVEPLKVDILVKKGADDKTAKKTTKATRQTAKSVVLKEVENEAPGRAKNLMRTMAKNLVPVKETTKNLSPEKKTTRNVPLEKGNTMNVPLTKSKTKNMLAEEKAKKLKATKVVPASDKEDNSLVIESENAADSNDTPNARSVRAVPKKIGKSTENYKTRSLRRSSEVKQGKDGPITSDVTTGKKFFKNKGVDVPIDRERILLGKKNMPSRRRKVDIREKPTVSTSFRLRQTTLSESFAKHATKKNLRPRNTQKNYREQSTILEKTVANVKEATKGPVYKTTKLLDKSDDEGSEIYEFHFDSNDSREKIAKKRKRKVGKSIVTKKTRATVTGSKKITSKSKVATKIEVKENKVEEPQTQFSAVSEKAMAKNNALAVVLSDFDLPPVTTEPTQPEKLETQAEQVELLKRKPKIIRSVKLTGERRINLTSTPELTKPAKRNAEPLRTTNAFMIRSPTQYRTMLSHALLNKSLSPIKKALESFDPGSPWRPPEITDQQFSQVKNIFQSTPQVQKFSTILEKTRDSVESKAKPELTAGARMNKIVEKNEENINVENKPIFESTRTQKVLELAKSPRKFGTEISNMNPSILNASPVVIQENSVKIIAVAPPRLADLSEMRISDGNDAVDDFDEYADKENFIPLFVSPKKSLDSPKRHVAKQSPLRPFNQSKTTTNDNWEPQPGPSGLQKQSPLDESRILKQSNLNNFLNIDQVPTNTSISAAHGIFADTHSTPINGKPVKTVAKELNVENAFGFDDNGDFDIDVSPIKSDQFTNQPTVEVAEKIVTIKQRENVEERNNATSPTRLPPVEEIKKIIPSVVEKEKSKDFSLESIEEEKKESRSSKKEKSGSKNERVSDATKFYDTFDVLTEADGTNDEGSVKEVPLFEDLIPVHFKEPPRYSYKRKRGVAFNVSEAEDADKDASTGQKNHRTKKKKISKVEKERQKKVEEWAKNLNNTFEEIDHFDLVVE